MRELVQGSPEWLEYRRNKIGASDAPAIMGVGYLTPLQLWEEKVCGVTREQTKAMKMGHEFEAEARAWFEDGTGHAVKPSVIEHKTIPYMIASLDGINAAGDILLEIKMNNKDNHSFALKGKCPEIHYPQLQHQLEVCGLDWMYYLSNNAGHFVLLKIERDDEYIAELLKQERIFWDCMQDFIPPPATIRDLEDKSASNEWAALATEWRRVYELLKHYENREDELRKKLIQECRGKSSKGHGVSVVQYQKKGIVKTADIPELQGKDLEIYRGPPVTCWRISCED